MSGSTPLAKGYTRHIPANTQGEYSKYILHNYLSLSSIYTRLVVGCTRARLRPSYGAR